MLIIDDFRYFIKKQGLITALFNLGLWSLFLYRIGSLMYNKTLFKVLLIWYVYLVFKNVLLLFSKIELPPTAKIGRRLNLVHAYGLVMGDKVVIGDDVTIGPWVVIGHNGDPLEQPFIGNYVYIGAKATILGNIFLDDNSIVGPNTVLTKSLGNSQIAKSAFCQIK